MEATWGGGRTQEGSGVESPPDSRDDEPGQGLTGKREGLGRRGGAMKRKEKSKRVIYFLKGRFSTPPKGGVRWPGPKGGKIRRKETRTAGY